ncbi:MAG: right-handed parallel beta-helix repeat-containing protein [Spirochaetes bacterium]|nr:right-handed parallel beta-helix repeat-containing protein [Spirochaetota bacterium]
MKNALLPALLVSAGLAFPQNPVDLAAVTFEAYASGKREITWPKGRYRVSPGAANTHLSLSNLTGLRIQAAGVTLVCTEVKTALVLRSCTNVELSGLTVDYDPLHFTQATVVAMDADDTGFDLKIHAGYPAIPMDEGELYLFDGKTRQWKAGAWSGPRKVRYQPKGELLHVFLEQAGARHAVAKGDFVVQKFKAKSAHVAILASCAATTLRGVTLHTGPTFAVLETDGERNAYLGVRITPGPPPPGATEARLMANLADGIHSISSRIGPRVEGCLIEGHSDDGVAIHGKYALVLDRTSGLVIAGHTETPPFSVGETLRLSAGSNGAILAEATLKAITALEAGERGGAEAIKNGMKLGNKQLYSSLRSYWRLALAPDFPLAPGDVIDSPTRSGSGFIVRGNTIRNHRARGILIKASDGVIEDNLIEHSSIAGIVLSPEISWWLESGYSWNVLIARNRIVDCGYEHVNGGHSQPAMITVCAAGMTRGLWAPAGGQRNIRIVSNTVERCRSLGLLITSARDVEVRGNRFIRPLEESWPSGSAFGVSSNTAVWVEDSERIRFIDNQAIQPGPFMKSMIGLGARTAAVSGAAGAE